ncbi:MAG TPA: hypothetical protein VFR74_10370 [Jiangellales bacterium]|nr:hypothetical protein [Jiangellales bacterium]
MGTQLAVVRLSSRLVRRGAVLVALGATAYVVVEAFSYEAAYPDAASRARLAEFGDEPAVRMLSGIPYAVDTVGGFVVWDGGYFLQVLAGIWALIATARLLRAEEDAERAELVLAGPVRATRAVALQLGVVLAGCLLIGAGVAGALAASGAQAAGSVAVGLAVAGFGSAFAGVAAVTSQLFEVRRRAVGAAAIALGLAFLLRMVSNSSDERAWVAWSTPFGWMDRMRAFGENRWWVLGLHVGLVAVLATTALVLRSRRDIGTAILASSDAPRPRLRLLGSPVAFAWRSSLGILAAWAAGLVLYTFVLGTLLVTMTDFLTEDPSYRAALELMGVDLTEVTQGLIGVMGLLYGLVFALYAAWRVGAARTEEATGRLEHLLTRPVPRWRWFGGHAVLTLVSAALLALVTGLALWAGSAVVGSDLTLADAVASTANTLPVVLLFAGVAFLVLGAAPRLTVGLTIGLAALTYVVQLVGPMLEWPSYVVGLSPFHHLAPVPAEPYALTAGLVMAGLGVAAGLLGVAAFERRDLAGA